LLQRFNIGFEEKYLFEWIDWIQFDFGKSVSIFLK
jgi:hypothetical protein